MATTTEPIPAAILDDLRDGLKHANTMRAEGERLRVMADGAVEEVRRRAAKALSLSVGDDIDLEAGTVTRATADAKEGDE